MNATYQLNNHKRPMLLSNDSYDDGRSGRQWSGYDLDGFIQGSNDRQRTEQVHQELQNRGNTDWGGSGGGGGGSGGGGGGGGGSGGGCGMIILVLLGIFPAILSGVAAIISGTLIFVISRLTASSFRLSFWEAYKTAFRTGFIYLIIACVLGALQTWLYPTMLSGGSEDFSIYGAVKFFSFLKGAMIVKPINMVEFHFICGFLSGLTLRRSLGYDEDGFIGYIKSFLVTILIIFPSLMAAFYLGIYLVLKHYHQHIPF